MDVGCVCAAAQLTLAQCMAIPSLRPLCFKGCLLSPAARHDVQARHFLAFFMALTVTLVAPAELWPSSLEAPLLSSVSVTGVAINSPKT